MERGARYQDVNSITPIETLPEEIFREIFNYLSFETLYFALRKVCKKIQTYVDIYIKVEGTSVLFGRQEGLENKVVEMIELPKNGPIILRGPVLSFPFVSDLHDKSIRSFVTKFTPLQLEKICDRRIQKVVYHPLGIGVQIVCYIYKRL